MEHKQHILHKNLKQENEIGTHWQRERERESERNENLQQIFVYIAFVCCFLPSNLVFMKRIMETKHKYKYITNKNKNTWCCFIFYIAMCVCVFYYLKFNLKFPNELILCTI